jgi:AraC family transcriptional regulator, transcriptional activator of pobA
MNRECYGQSNPKIGRSEHRESRVIFSSEAIPTYALYGESVEAPSDLWAHCESIPARSALFDWEISLHRHQSFFQILYVSRGSTDFRVETDRFALGPNVLLTVPPRAVHGFRFSEDVEGFVMTARIERIEQMLSGSPGVRALFLAPRVLDLSRLSASAARISLLVETIAAESASSREGRWALVEANLVILLIEMARLIESKADADSALPGGVNRHARHFQTLVDRHFRSERAVAFYAGALGVSETHLNRIARQAFDRSALGVINQRLLREAARNLTFTPFPVKEIAYALGFEDPAYFTRFFTKQMGLSPTAFRTVEARRSGEDYRRQR